MTIFRIYDRLPSCISMEAGARPELNAQRYAERWLSLSKPPYGIVRTTGTSTVLGRLILTAVSPETLVHAFRMKGYLNFWELRSLGSREGNNEKF